MTQTLAPPRRPRRVNREHRPPTLVEVFESAWLLDANLSREGWRYLWERYGAAELVRIGRRSGWFVDEDDASAMQLLKRWSRAAGYDPDGSAFDGQT